VVGSGEGADSLHSGPDKERRKVTFQRRSFERKVGARGGTVNLYQE